MLKLDVFKMFANSHAQNTMHDVHVTCCQQFHCVVDMPVVHDHEFAQFLTNIMTHNTKILMLNFVKKYYLWSFLP